jgi:hypothetical protein
MRVIDIFISGGSDTDRHRDVAADAISRLRQVIEYEMRLDVTLRNWDYRLSSPTVVPRGGLSAASLANVDRSDALVAIFGRRLPRITQDEIRRAFVRRQRGEQEEVFVFANRDRLTDRHNDFFEGIENEFNEAIVFAYYSDLLSFQAIVYSTLFGFLFTQLVTASPSLLPGGAR